MGNSQTNNTLNPSNPYKSYSFEYLEPLRTEPNSNNWPSTWSRLSLIYSSTNLLMVTSEGLQEELLIDSDFKILNEQPENCILTLQFNSSSSSVLRTCKIRPKEPSDFISWKATLQDLLRSKWTDQKKCEVCLKHFGLVRRKHHCRKCFRCVCRKCSQFRSTLPELGFQELVRLCRLCSRTVLEKRSSKGER
jgi:hypothetical protein